MLCLQTCRVCGRDQALEIAEVEFFGGYAWPMYDCASCGCRFSRHDPAAYETLHAAPSSCYHRYLLQLDHCKALFDRGDAAGLRTELCRSSKYRFVIETTDDVPAGGRFLEIGAARGHLTSYFILTNRRITGVDISPTAVASARRNFGDHFRVAGDPAVEDVAPYDVIFHVGTIGCVEDPIGMTRRLLGLLKPGGQLLFNAPNREGLAMRHQLWFDGAPPPDVVTLFPPNFWTRHFADEAEVSDTVEIGEPIRNLLIGLGNLVGRTWRMPVTVALGDSEHPAAPPSRWSDRLWRAFERVVRKAAPPLGLLRLAPPYPAEFGLLIQMKKH